MGKRGLSAVVTTLIIILLVLVAIGVVWVVISNLITSGAEEISLGKFTINMEIKNVEVKSDGTVDVIVKRNPGKGELTGIKFLVSDGQNVIEVERETTIGELGQKTFSFSASEVASLIYVKDVSIAPVLKLDSGKESVGNEIDNFPIEYDILFSEDFESYTLASELSGNWDAVTQTSTVTFPQGYKGNSIKSVDVSSLGIMLDKNIPPTNRIMIKFFYKHYSGKYGMHEGVPTLREGGSSVLDTYTFPSGEYRVSSIPIRNLNVGWNEIIVIADSNNDKVRFWFDKEYQGEFDLTQPASNFDLVRFRSNFAGGEEYELDEIVVYSLD